MSHRQLPFDVAVPHILSNPDLIAISLDWTEGTPRRRSGESNAEFASRKDWFMKGLTARWKGWKPEPDGPRDPAVIGPLETGITQSLLRFAWSPAWFQGNHRTIPNFLLSRLLVFDFDDGWPHDEVLARCRSLGIRPWITYASASWTAEHERFRLLILLDSYVIDVGVYRSTLRTIAKHVFHDRCDRRCLEPSRGYLPGGRVLLAGDPAGDVISLGELGSAIEIAIRESDDSGHAARSISKIRRDLRLDADDLAPPGPGIGESTPDSINIRESEIGGDSPISRVERAPNPGGRGREGGATSSAARVRTLDLPGFAELLVSRCRLAAEFVRGATPAEAAADPAEVEGWLHQDELYGLMSSVNCVRGGRKWFLAGIARFPHLYERHDRGRDHWVPRLTTHADNGRLPQTCGTFCPYVDQCHSSGTILQTVRRRYDFAILEPVSTVPLTETRSEMAEMLPRLLADHTHGGRNLFISDTGTGKSDIVVEWQVTSGEPVIIAAPTHRLKDEIAGRLREKGGTCVTTPELPADLPPAIRSEIDALHLVGDHDGARRYVLDHQRDCPALAEYMAALERARSSPHTVVTTQARVALAGDDLFPERTLNLDEDPLRAMWRSQSCHLSDLIRLLESMRSAGAPGAEALGEFVRMLREAEPKMVHDTPVGLVEAVRPAGYLRAAGIRTDLLSLLASDRLLLTQQGDDRIIFHSRLLTLPASRRVIALSATADPTICRLLLGEGLQVHRMPLVEPVGSIIQDMTRTYSRADLRRNGEPEPPPGYAVITFKATREAYGDDAVLHYGATEGIDEYRGRDMAVIGTPHYRAETYHLLAASLGREDLRMARLHEAKVERHGMRFTFMTYDEPLLRDVQLGMIGSELEQAVGRARVLTEACTVRVYSNFPLRRARHEV